MSKSYFEKRLTLLSVPVIYRSRVRKSRGYKLERTANFNMLHLGKRSLLVQRFSAERPIWNAFTWDEAMQYGRKVRKTFSFAKV